MPTWRLTDGSTGNIDRATDTVTRPADSWVIHSEEELSATLDSLGPGTLRAMSLESDRCRVGFGFGSFLSFVEGSHKQPPYCYRQYFRDVRAEDCHGRDVPFQLWQDDLLEFCGEQLIRWEQAREILMWIVRHDDFPEWDAERGCRPAPLTPLADEEPPF